MYRACIIERDANEIKIEDFNIPLQQWRNDTYRKIKKQRS
jgi:hypothetical protein